MQSPHEPDGYLSRLAQLDASLTALGRVAVAFSGGVDSSVLLHAAHRVLGNDNAAGVIADSPSLPRRELADARQVAGSIGARLVILATHELADERYVSNRGDRCYFCKSALFAAMEPWAREHGFAALAFGEIQDDLLDHRPGRVAAREFGVVAPLAEAGLTKNDVRWYARSVGLPVADKPASACLASRIPVGTVVTRERLERVERAEELVRSVGLHQLRVRDHGPTARVEVGRDEVEFARAHFSALESLLTSVGFERVELAVYRTALERASDPAGH